MLLSSFYHASILSHDTFARSLAFVLANRLADATLLATELFEIFQQVSALRMLHFISPLPGNVRSPAHRFLASIWLPTVSHNRSAICLDTAGLHLT